MTVQSQPMIAVRDVEASSRWYQQLLGVEGGHGGPEYEMLLSDGALVLQLHHWEADEHPHLGDPKAAVGNGTLLWFATDDFDAAVTRARKISAHVLEGPLFNPNAQQRELWVRDPDGYVVVLAGPRGDDGSSG